MRLINNKLITDVIARNADDFAVVSIDLSLPICAEYGENDSTTGSKYTHLYICM